MSRRPPVAYIIITLPTFPAPNTSSSIYIDVPLLCAFGFQTLALVVTLVAAILGNFQVKTWLGVLLIVVYAVFIVVTVLAIEFGPADWRLRIY